MDLASKVHLDIKTYKHGVVIRLEFIFAFIPQIHGSFASFENVKVLDGLIVQTGQREQFVPPSLVNIIGPIVNLYIFRIGKL